MISKATKETMKKLYPQASEEDIVLHLNMAEKYKLDPETVQMNLFYSDIQKKHVSKITRYGYRLIARSQPEYVEHGYFSLYTGDRIKIADGKIDIVFGSTARGIVDLVGAIGWLKKKDGSGNETLVYTRVSYVDYINRKHAWDKDSGVPDAMIQKEAEINVIKLAFYSLFLDDPNEGSNIDELEDESESLRGDIIKYIKENKSYLSGMTLPRPLEQFTYKELCNIRDQIIDMKENKND